MEPTVQPTQSPEQPSQVSSQHSVSRYAFATSAVMRELNLLKNEVRDIKSTLSSLSCAQESDMALRNEVASIRLTLSGILNNKHHAPDPLNGISQTITRQPCILHETQTSLHISAWNCRGLSNAIPYLQSLAEVSDMIVIDEHWLWPFELSKLDRVVPGFVGVGCSDARLHEKSILTRGCGGVGVIWRSSLPVNKVQISSDRIVAVQLKISNSTTLSIVYRGISPNH